jgi:hypothetical protein
MSIEAMKQALDALEYVWGSEYTGTKALKKSKLAIDALRQAIEQSEQMQPVPSIIQMLGHCPECGAKAHNFTAPPPRQPLFDTDTQRALDIYDKAAHGIKEKNNG